MRRPLLISVETLALWPWSSSGRDGGEGEAQQRARQEGQDVLEETMASALCSRKWRGGEAERWRGRASGGSFATVLTLDYFAGVFRRDCATG